MSFSGQVGILGPPSAGAPTLQPLQPPSLSLPSQPPPSTGGAGSGQQVWPPRLTPAQVESELVGIKRVQTVVERLESKLGNTHPQVRPLQTSCIGPCRILDNAWPYCVYAR